MRKMGPTHTSAGGPRSSLRKNDPVRSCPTWLGYVRGMDVKATQHGEGLDVPILVLGITARHPTIERVSRHCLCPEHTKALERQLRRSGSKLPIKRQRAVHELWTSSAPCFSAHPPAVPCSVRPCSVRRWQPDFFRQQFVVPQAPMPACRWRSRRCRFSRFKAGLSEKASAPAPKYNWHAGRDPSGSLSEPDPPNRPPIVSGLRAAGSLLLGPAAHVSQFRGRLMRIGPPSWLLDQIDSKQVFLGS